MSSTGLYLKPGDRLFGDGQRALKAVVGSCVAVSVWHPQRRVGAMCRYLLPQRDDGPPQRERASGREGRYGREALTDLALEIHRRKLDLRELEVGIYGGADLFSAGAPELFNVGRRNVDIAYAFCDAIGVEPCHLHVGGQVHRHVMLDLVGGGVTVRRQAAATGGWQGE